MHRLLTASRVSLLHAVGNLPRLGRHASSQSHPDLITVRVQQLVAAYRKFGHLHADIDPLGLQVRPAPAELGLSYAGLADTPLHSNVDTRQIFKSFSGDSTLEGVVSHLKHSYCGKIAFQFDYLEVCTFYASITLYRPRSSEIGLHRKWRSQQLRPFLHRNASALGS